MEEKREGYCPVHHIKCEQIKDATDAVEDLRKNKLSIRIFQIIVGIILTIGGAYWYKMDVTSNDYKEQISISLKLHNKILKRMSLDVRELQLNIKPVMKKLDLEYQMIPQYYGDNGDKDKSYSDR